MHSSTRDSLCYLRFLNSSGDLFCTLGRRNMTRVLVVMWLVRYVDTVARRWGSIVVREADVRYSGEHHRAQSSGRVVLRD